FDVARNQRNVVGGKVENAGACGIGEQGAGGFDRSGGFRVEKEAARSGGIPLGTRTVGKILGGRDGRGRAAESNRLPQHVAGATRVARQSVAAGITGGERGGSGGGPLGMEAEKDDALRGVALRRIGLAGGRGKPRQA